MVFNLPESVLEIIDLLNRNGFECYAVGGCVRDMMLDITPKDYDLTTNARPSEILEVFKNHKTFDTGIKHGTVSVIINDTVYEITTYRIDGDYLDSRHPENVKFTTCLREDLSRRDFTINAMAYNPQNGLVDYFGGEEDVKYGAIRCVGKADVRFREDALRILRALRFASIYGFSIEFNTLNAILNNKGLLNNISKERIASELTKILCGESCDFILRRFKEVFAVIIPEISAMFGYDQNTPHHNKTLWKHTVASVKGIESDEVLRMTMLLHDIGKPVSEKRDEKGISHFNGHPKISAAMARVILKRLRFPNDFISKVELLITYHDLRIKPEKFVVKRLLRDIGEENFRMLIKVQRADIMAQSMYERKEKLFNKEQLISVLNEIIDNGECYRISELDINGSDLIHKGITEGKKIGETLDFLLNLVMHDRCENKKEELLKHI